VRRAAPVLLACLFGPASSALAAGSVTVPYTVQVAGTGATAYWKPTLTLGGQTVTGFSMQVVPQQCATTTPSRISNDESFDITLPAATPISQGRFTFQDQAPSSYGQHINGQDYVGTATVTGVVTTTLGGQTSITGTVTLEGASDPFNSGCSGSWTFTAIPKVTQPPWGVPTKRSFVAYSATAHQGLSFNYRSGVVRDLVIEDNFTCAGQEDAVEIDAADYGFADIHTSASGSFQMKTFVLDEYGYIVRIDLTGRVKGHHASGRILMSEPASGYFQLGQAGKTCTGDAPWNATYPSALVHAPEAFFQWIAIRVPAGAAYHYYFAVAGLRCTNGATEVALTVAGRTRIVACSQSIAWASRPLTPGVSYNASAQAIAASRGRVRARGVSVSEELLMPSADSAWIPISGPPGTPPS
jgi:hypothetical protein